MLTFNCKECVMKNYSDDILRTIENVKEAKNTSSSVDDENSKIAKSFKSFLQEVLYIDRFSVFQQLKDTLESQRHQGLGVAAKDILLLTDTYLGEEKNRFSSMVKGSHTEAQR